MRVWEGSKFFWGYREREDRCRRKMMSVLERRRGGGVCLMENVLEGVMFI